MSCIHYKFRSSLEYDTITFDGLAISLADLKKAIMAQKKFAKVTDFDLEVTNAQTKEEYKDEIMQIPKNSSVIVRRIPTGTRSKAQLAADRAENPYASGLPKTKSDIQELQTSVSMKQNKVVDLVSSDASEDDKLKAMMTQAGEDWQPNQYVKGRGRGYNPSGPLPPNYVCYRCGKPGHFIRNCPTNGVKRTIGIPRTFNEDQDGTAEDSNKDSKKDSSDPSIKKLVPVPELDASKKDRKVPSELQCPMCKNLLTDAVLIPCCGTSYCDECIRTYLLENEQVCPTCGAEDVSPDSLIINKQLRQAVNNFRNARPASPFVNSTTDKPTPNSTADKPVPSSTVDKPITSSISEKTAPTTSEPETKLAAAKSEVNSPASSDKDKSEQKVSSTTSEIPQKDVTEVKEEEVKKKEGSPLPVLKAEVSSPRRDAEDHRLLMREPHRTLPRPVGPHVVQHPGYGPHDHPLHRGPVHRPNLGHPMADAMIPRSIPPEGPLLVPTLRAPRPLLPQPHPGPLMAQPGFIGPAALGLHPVAGHPGIVQPLLGAPIPFGVNPAGFRPFDNRRHVEGLPPMSEEEFYRYQRKMKLRSKRKHRDKEREGDRHSKKERSSSRRPPGNFDDELSQYRALQRHRTRRRSRSRSYSRSPSRSRSNSRSVSRSLSQSSRSLSKSPTPEDWDRSRTPSPALSPTISRSKTPPEGEEKKTKQKKRKKHHKQKHSKKSKASESEGENKKPENKEKEKEAKEKTEKKKSKSKKKSKDKEKSSKSRKKSKSEENEETEKSEKVNSEESVAELKESEHTELSMGHVQELDEPLVESKEESGEQNVEEKEESKEKEEVSTENEEDDKNIESTETGKSRKRKSEEKEGEDGSKKKKSKEKSSEKKHKKKKHKKKHKRHKKEKEKRSSQSAEGNNDSTEETQEDSDEEKDQERAETAKE